MKHSGQTAVFCKYLRNRNGYI